MKNQRLVYMDVIRVFACICITTIHFNATVDGYNISGQFLYNNQFIPNTYFGRIYLGEIGNCLFFMLSGAGLQYAARRRKRKMPYFSFIWKRAKAIYPGYWVAMALAFSYDIVFSHWVNGGSIWQLLLNVAGLDVYPYLRGWISATPFYQLGEWFLGCLLICYLFWPLIDLGLSKKPIATLVGISAIMLIWLWKKPQDSTSVVVRLTQMSIGAVMIQCDMPRKSWKLLLFAIGLFTVTVLYKKYVDEVIIDTVFCWALYVTITYIVELFPVFFNELGAFFEKAGALTYPIFLVHHKAISVICNNTFDLANLPRRFVVVLYVAYWLITILLALLVQKLSKMFVKSIEFVWSAVRLQWSAHRMCIITMKE